jgi:alpha-tubulin suppressor-like RCC1 family protein
VLSNIIFAEANDHVSFAIDTNGTLYGWGDNSKGQISPASSDLKIFKPMKLMENVISVSAGETHTVAVTADGKLGCSTSGVGVGSSVGTSTGSFPHATKRIDAASSRLAKLKNFFIYKVYSINYVKKTKIPLV